jgi:hypothetical protein
MKNKSKFHIFLENSEILKEEYNKDKKSFLEKRFNGEETFKKTIDKPNETSETTYSSFFSKIYPNINQNDVLNKLKKNK